MEPLRIEKPWGYELRFATTERYAGKVLFVHAGQQLSLQHHERKDESFLIYSGVLDLVVGSRSSQRVERLRAGQARHIAPGTVHRFRAVTDCTLFEVSTPDLDDVVRHEDDFGREGTSDD